MRTSALWGHYPIFTSWDFFIRTHHREWLQSNGCQNTSILSFLSSLSSPLTVAASILSFLSSLSSPLTVAAITGDCDILVYWYRRKYFISQPLPASCVSLCSLACNFVCLVVQSCPATPWTVARQARLSPRFSRQEYWSGLPSFSPGHIPDLGIKPSLLLGRQILCHWASWGRPSAEWHSLIEIVGIVSEKVTIFVERCYITKKLGICISF